ncbi:MAG: helix-turn-helix domain-containing protein [Desulfitobacterium hafniense]|nr:helix-turn-helix domain-containing protein [Desulfitobacterium hafniense]
MLFGDRLRTMREGKGLTQDELGKLIGVSDRVVGYYEANVRFPKNPDTLRRISQVFSVSVDYLLGIELGSEHKTEGYFLSDAGRKAKELLRDVQDIFNSEQLSEKDKVEFFRLISEMYFGARKEGAIFLKVE